MSSLVADGIVGRLREWGVKRIFGYAGDGIDPILAALHRADGTPEFVSTRHEEMAAFMACGHAKYTGEVGVCLATQGPGAIHLLAGLYDAKLDRRPVVAIVGQVVSTALGSGYLQEVDLHPLFKDVCGQFVQTILSPEQLPMALDNAMRTAIATSTPTCLIVPHDVQKETLPQHLSHSHGIVPSSAVIDHRRIVPAPDRVKEAAEVLNAGRRVALLIGRGAAGSAEEIARITTTLGAGVTASLLGKPVIDENAPWHTGVMGHLGTTASADLMANCDTLLIIGCNDPWTEFYPSPGQVRAVQIDTDPRVLGAKFPIEVGIVGDAATTLSQLLPLLEGGPDRGWSDTVEGYIQRWKAVAARTTEDAGDDANPEFVVAALNEHLPANARLAVDVGSATYWYAKHVRLPRGVPAHVSGYLASMGCAMPYGIAAKLDAPDRPVVALVGDGAMQMNGLLELITVAHRWREWADPRFVVLVLHNRDLAEVSWEQREMEGDPRYPASQRVPDFPYAQYAEMLGLAGIRIDRSAQAGDAWRAAFAADRPTLIEAVVDADTPLLPPNVPDGKVSTVRDAVAQEVGGAAVAERIDRHVAAERADQPG